MKETIRIKRIRNWVCWSYGDVVAGGLTVEMMQFMLTLKDGDEVMKVITIKPEKVEEKS